MVRNLARSMVGACALVAAPLMATTIIPSYGLTFTAIGNSAANGTAGNGALFSATAADGSTITATVTAWNATLATSGTNAGRYVLSQAYLGRYADGLGITATNGDAPAGFGCGIAGNCGAQQIDNAGNSDGSTSYDFLQLSFNAPVTLASFTRVSTGAANGGTTFFGTAAYDYDDDFSYGSSAGAVANGQVLSSLDSLLATNVGNSGACGGPLGSLFGCSDTTALTAEAASRQWYIGASIGSNYGGDGLVDSFRAQALTVRGAGQTSAVPESSTWAMMIFGFGAIGIAIRRKNAGLKRLMRF